MSRLLCGLSMLVVAVGCESPQLGEHVSAITCTSAPQCNDMNACTTDSCDLSMGSPGQCVNAPIAGCCNTDTQCNDGNTCTTDFCISFTRTCSNVPQLGCCDTDSDCADADTCTADTCNVQTGVCLNAEISGCCTMDAQCDDTSACTTDSCNLTTNACTTMPIPGCCDDNADCADNSVCTTDTCNVGTGVCTNAAMPGCCTTSVQCNDSNPCTADVCNPFNNTCANPMVPGCCLMDAECADSDVCTSDTCDSTTNTCTNSAIVGCCISHGQCDDGSSCTTDSCNLTTNRCTTTAIPGCCDNNADCADNSVCTTDTCDVSTGLCTNAVVAGCCVSSSQCSDGNACTADFCSPTSNTCTNTAVPGCCDSNADCMDSSACTADTCDTATGLCTNAAIAGCCTSDQQCNDTNACTTDTCNTATKQCTSTVIAGCCAQAADCDDADPCTADSCDGGACQHAAIPDCVPEMPDGGPTNGVDLRGGGCACDARSSGANSGLLLAFVVGACVLRRRRRRAARRGVTIAIAVPVVLLVVADVSFADGFDAQFYQAATSSSGYLTMESGSIIARGHLDVGASFDYARDPLVAADPMTGDPLMDGKVVANRLGLQLVAGYGVLPWLEVGIAIPMILVQDGDLSTIDAGQSLSTTATGDLRLFGKVPLWRNETIRLAAAIDVTLPSGNEDSFTGGATATARPRMIAGWRSGPIAVALNLGYRVRGKSEVANLVIDDEVTAGVAAAYEARADRLWIVGEGFLAAGVFGEDHAVPAQVLLGVRSVIAGPWRGQLAVGEGLGAGYSTPAFHAVVSVMYAKDRQEVPRGPKDTDRDGLFDPSDRCPTEPEDKDAYQDDDGCPDLDDDNDSIVDLADKCPRVPEDVDGFEDADGCPELDNDADGIPDAADGCPVEAEDKDSFQDEDGCPDLDNDGDGIADAVDQCPTVAEVKNGYLDEDGCADDLPKRVKQFTGVVKGINFKVNSADLLPSSSRTLDEAIAVLKEYPALNLEIQGHTDDQPIRRRGVFKTNIELSQARAESVRAYLMAMGIDDGRLTAKGYGETRPIVDPAGLKGRKLAVARAKNRRVEFVIVVAP